MSPTVASSGKTNKVAVVLGASSKGGTGWATAELFAEQGANVVVGARSQAGIEELAPRIRRPKGTIPFGQNTLRSLQIFARVLDRCGIDPKPFNRIASHEHHTPLFFRDFFSNSMG